MSKLDRTFLVPYLQNLCATELHIKKLKHDIKDSEYAINRIYNEYNCAHPYPHKYKLEEITFEDIFNTFLVSCVLSGIILVLSIIFKWIVSPVSFFAMLSTFPILMIITFISRAVEKHNGQNDYDEQYAQNMVIYKECMKKLEEHRPRINELEQHIKYCTNEIQKAEMLLNELYSVNVIPMQYRGMYSTVYLHNLFSTSMEDDVIAALQLFVLEEIKAKLDHIIYMCSESILNQQIMIANQNKSLEMQQEHQAIMEQRAKEIAHNQEEQTTYMRMIASDVSSMSYYAACEYYQQ